MPDPLDRVFAALADPTRREVLLHLLEHDTATVPELVESAGMTRQGLLKHMRFLDEAGLIERASEQPTRPVVYRLKPLALNRATEWMTAADAAWAGRLGRLNRAARRREAEAAAGSRSTSSASSTG